MEKNRKGELLKQIELLRQKLEHYESQAFFGFLSSSSKTYYLQKRSVEEYIKFIYYTTLQTKQINTGGKASEEGYKKFIKEELKITKSGEKVTIGNPIFKTMNMEELAFVLGWLRRLAPEKDKKQSSNNRTDNRRNKNGNYISSRNNDYHKNKKESKTYSGEEWHGNNVFEDFFGKK